MQTMGFGWGGLLAWVALASMGTAQAAVPASEIERAMARLSQRLGQHWSTLWSDTYEARALADRLKAQPYFVPLDETDFHKFALEVSSSQSESNASELLARMERLAEAFEAGPRTLVSLKGLARDQLSQAPLTPAARLQFLAPQSLDESYAAARASFARANDIQRTVEIPIRMGYSRFQPDILKRLAALGFEVHPSFRDATVVLLGKAPQSSLAKLSGVDGVEHVFARERRVGRDIFAQAYYVRGVRLSVE